MKKERGLEEGEVLSQKLGLSLGGIVGQTHVFEHSLRRDGEKGVRVDEKDAVLSSSQTMSAQLNEWSNPGINKKRQTSTHLPFNHVQLFLPPLRFPLNLSHMLPSLLLSHPILIILPKQPLNLLASAGGELVGKDINVGLVMRE